MKNLTFTLTVVFLLISLTSFSQNNAIIIDGAYIIIDGGTATNNINMVINQPNPLGIVRLSSGGHINSENQYNVVKWISGTTTGSYVFPFGVGGNATDYIPFTFNKTAGNSNINVSTWATNSQNIPHANATNVAAVTNMTGTADSVLYALDRFWDIQATATTADLTFSYRGIENTTLNPTNLVKAQHWNGSSWDTPVGIGTAGVTTGIGTAGPFIGQNTFSPWVLITTCTTNTLTQNPIICQGDSIIVGANTYTTTGTFIDTLTNTQGCDSIVTTNLTVNPLSTISAMNDTSLCLGNPFLLTATGSGNGTITWYSDVQGATILGTGSTYTPIISNTGINVFYVSETGACASGMDSVTITVGGVTAIINATPTTGTIPLSIFFGNGSTPNVTYMWDFGDGNNSTQFEPSNVYSNIGSYTVTLIVSDGICTDSASINIDTYGKSTIIIPNVFTPNGDGNNDVFTVDGVNLESVEGEIYNRWGEKIFGWNNIKGYWNGRTTAGNKVPDGTYFYIIKAQGIDGQKYLKKGSVSLMR